MKNVPIPPASPSDKADLAKLAKRAAKLAAAGDYAGLADVENDIDKIVYRLFGLTKDEIAQVETSLANTRVRAAEDESDGEDDEE
jgi:hypothetical protein